MLDVLLHHLESQYSMCSPGDLCSIFLFLISSQWEGLLQVIKEEEKGRITTRLALNTTQWLQQSWDSTWLTTTEHSSWQVWEYRGDTCFFSRRLYWEAERDLDPWGSCLVYSFRTSDSIKFINHAKPVLFSYMSVSLCYVTWP